jgi:hypothetical protein
VPAELELTTLTDHLRRQGRLECDHPVLVEELLAEDER